MRNIEFRSARSFALKPYTSHSREAVKDLLLGWPAIPGDEVTSLLQLLDTSDAPERPPEAIGQLALTLEDKQLLGISLVEPVPLMWDRWMIRLLVVDVREKDKGLGTALLRRAESFVARYSGKYLGAEVPGFLDSEVVERFFWSQGYRSYDGVGFAKRYPRSRYFVRDLRISSRIERWM